MSDKSIQPKFDIVVALATGDSRLFGARHFATPPDWRILWQSYDSGRLRVHLGFISALLFPQAHDFSVFLQQ
jgi:hypothetical protein